MTLLPPLRPIVAGDSLTSTLISITASGMITYPSSFASSSSFVSYAEFPLGKIALAG